MLETLIKLYIIKNNIKYTESQTWLEKTPGHAKYIDKIVSLFPTSKFISIIRSPYASIPSVAQKLSMVSDNAYLLSSNWGALYRKILVADKSSKTSILFIKYEQLLNDRSKEIEKVMTFLSLPFYNDKLDSFTEKANQLITPTEEWKKNNSSANFKNKKQKHSTIIQFPNEDILQKFGYEVIQLSSSAKTKLKLAFKYHILSVKVNRWFHRTFSSESK